MSKIILITGAVILLIVHLFLCGNVAAIQIDNNPPPDVLHLNGGHKPVVQELVDLVNTNNELRTALENALAEQDVSSYWHGKTLDDMYAFFDEWLVFLPTPDTARQYMDQFYEFADDGQGREVVAAEPFRSWLYDFMMARGEFMDSIESAAILPVWLADPDLNMQDYIIPAGGYRSFNEFFTRQLKPGVRPIVSPFDVSILTSPADSTALRIADKMTAESIILVKGESLNVRELLGNNALAGDFINGKALLCMLATTNYHRFHSPVSGKIISQQQLAGLYYGMDGGWIEYFFQHRRGYFIFDTQDYGHVAMVCIGMFTISSVNFITGEGDFVVKGQELGNFAYGGSAIILLFEPGRVEFIPDIEQSPVHILMGRKIGDMIALSEETVMQFNTFDSSSSPVTEYRIPTPSRIVTKYLEVQPKTATTGQDITITANMVNNGDTKGNYTATLTINGTLEKTAIGTISGHATIPIQFVVSRDEPGRYIVDINGQQSSFIVERTVAGFQYIYGYIPIFGCVLCLLGIIAITAILIVRRNAVH